MAEESEEVPQLVSGPAFSALCLVQLDAVQHFSDLSALQNWTGAYDEAGKPDGQVQTVLPVSLSFAGKLQLSCFVKTKLNCCTGHTVLPCPSQKG